jgi:hypothetical protein
MGKELMHHFSEESLTAALTLAEERSSELTM